MFWRAREIVSLTLVSLFQGAFLEFFDDYSSMGGPDSSNTDFNFENFNPVDFTSVNAALESILLGGQLSTDSSTDYVVGWVGACEHLPPPQQQLSSLSHTLV